jgi:hypothetical protein
MAEIIFEVVCYVTGRLLLPLLSLGRIKVAPLREPIGRARVLPIRSTGDIVASEGWTTFAGAMIWIAVIMLGALLYHHGLS